MARLGQSVHDENSFSVSTALKLVPSFEEKHVAEFFIAFEKIARKLNWPQEIWTTLLQCKLIGKAQRVYSTLDEDLSANYDNVKAIILRAYELVPEAYRQKFREYRKAVGQSFVEFARIEEKLFDDWLKSKEADDVVKIKQVMLIEEFKNCVARDLKVHLEELKLESLQEVAIAADEYALSHKNFDSRNKIDRPSSWNSWRNNKNEGSRYGKQNRCSPPRRSPPRRSPPRRSPVRQFKGSYDRIECYYCRKKGHVRSQCRLYKEFLEKEREKDKKPVNLISGSLVTDQDFMPTSVEGNHFVPVTPKGFENHMYDGMVYSQPGHEGGKAVRILRDTGALQSLILRSALPNDFEVTGNEYVLLGGFPNTVSSCPREKVWLDCKFCNDMVSLAIVDILPVVGVDVVLANDIADGRKVSHPVVGNHQDEKVHEAYSECRAEAPINMLTRAKSKQVEVEEGDLESLEKEEDRNSFRNSRKVEEQVTVSKDLTGWDQEALRLAQLSEFKETEEISEEPKELVKPVVRWFQGVLCRFSRAVKATAEGVEIKKQIVVPEKYRKRLLCLAHESHLAGHFGVNKTMGKLCENFFWPGIRKDVKRYVRSCRTCQVVGKPNQKIPKAPLVPIPVVGEPFSEVIIDIVGPLPRTKSGHEYLLTLIDRMSKYPEAMPLRSIKSQRIVEELIKFFTKFGMPKVLQSDCGSNFTCRYFEDSMESLGVKHVLSSPYHPESQGQVERFHQTLKSMLKKYCHENESDWDKEVPYLLFAFRSAPSEALGCTPFQLVFGHCVRGPLDVVKECWDGEIPKEDLISYLSDLGTKLTTAWEFAKKQMVQYQNVMKSQYDKKVKSRVFSEGDKVLVLLPIPGNPLKATFSGPWKIGKKISDINYLVETPERRKKYQLCHINMLKPFVDRQENAELLVVKMDNNSCKNNEEGKNEQTGEGNSFDFPKANSEIFNHLSDYLQYLNVEEREAIIDLICDFQDIFKDVPGRTTLLEHDVDIGGAKPIKQCPYRLNPRKEEIVNREVQYMLDNDLVEPSSSPWSSPVVLVKKEDGQDRLCFDYRRLNEVTETDSYPLPRVEDCIDQVGNAQYISKFDLLKGYWQVGLTPRARMASAFVTKRGLFECKVMPFGMKNAAATFQRLMNIITQDLEGCVVYIDDIVIYSQDWNTHLDRIRKLFEALRRAGLVVNLRKSEFAKATVVYLGHKVGHGSISPKDSNVKAILELTAPRDRRGIRKFLGMIGYYRRFIRNFSVIASPLTNLLRKQVKFVWNKECEKSFNALKAVIINYPILRSPDFSRSFELYIDASDLGVGAMLTQESKEGSKHPVAYFSRKLTGAQKKYSTVEKETLGLILALQHFEVYLGGAKWPVRVFTDHNPLKFLNRFKTKNQRLLRWSILLQEWNLDIHHVPGKDNVIPDVLSRA